MAVLCFRPCDMPMRTMTRLFLAFALLALPMAASAQDKIFRAGAAASNITPPLGSPIVGGFTEPPATHVHDELFVRALVLDDGSTKLAIVLCDSVGITRVVYDEAK